MNQRFPLLVIFLTIFIDLLGFSIIIPILPSLAVNMGGGESALAVAALYSVMNFLFAPLWGTLSDRYGRRPIILVSILITAVANFIFAYAGFAFWILIIQRCLSGIGSANISAANAYVADISDRESRAKNMGLIGAAFGLGFIFGPTIGGYLKAHFGLLGVGLVSGGLSLFNLLLAYIALPESLREKNHTARLNLDPVTPLFKAMHNRLVRDIFLLNFIFIMAFSAMQVTAAVLWEKHFLLSELQVSYVFTYLGVVSAIVQGTLVGPLNKAFGEKRLLIVGFLMMMIGMAALPFMPNIWWELAALGLTSLANGCITPSLLSILSGNTEASEQGKLLGLNQSFGSLGRVAGPLAGGPLYALHYSAPYLVAAALLAIALLFTFDIYRKKVFV